MINKIKKIFLKIMGFLVKMLVYINGNLYMKFFSKYLKILGIKINGKPKFIAGSVYFDGKDYGEINLGDNIVISKEVMFLTHDYSISRGLQAIGKLEDKEAYFLRGISIGDNCFIGARVSILPGTIIGNNVIIGACSVVKGEIPDNSIVVGNPCKIIGKTTEWAKGQELKRKYFFE
jgi:acetyltransferase-like isoleucine patch superfamily enzyme